MAIRSFWILVTLPLLAFGLSYRPWFLRQDLATYRSEEEDPGAGGSSRSQSARQSAASQLLPSIGLPFSQRIIYSDDDRRSIQTPWFIYSPADHSFQSVLNEGDYEHFASNGNFEGIFMTQTKIILQHCMSGNLRKTHMRANNVLISAYQTVRFWVLCQLQKKSISVIGFIVGSDMQIGIFST